MSDEEIEIEKAKIELEMQRLQLAEDLQRRELFLKEKQFDKRSITTAQATVVGALVALASGLLGAVLNNSADQTISETSAANALDVERVKVQGTLDLENAKQASEAHLAELEFEASLIMQAIQTEHRDEAIRNLRFFVEAGFLSDREGKITALEDDELPSRLVKVGQPLIDDRQISDVGSLNQFVTPAELPKSNFETWVDNFSSRAEEAGVPIDIIKKAKPHFKIDVNVLNRDNEQAKFAKSAMDYIAFHVDSNAVELGEVKFRELQSGLRDVEVKFGVPPEIILAIWGLETRYGSFMGEYNVLSALSTLAYDGRRKDFAERQLLSALKLIEADSLQPENLKGSWGGAMGHMQFTPNSQLEFGIDFDGDGKRDPYSELDALASTANFLSKVGWETSTPWGYRVISTDAHIPANDGQFYPFSELQAYGLEVEAEEQPSSSTKLSVVRIDSEPELVFAVTKNFDAIRRYNNSLSYAMSVGLLSDLLGGRGDFPITWLGTSSQ